MQTTLTKQDVLRKIASTPNDQAIRIHQLVVERRFKVEHESITKLVNQMEDEGLLEFGDKECLELTDKGRAEL